MDSASWNRADTRNVRFGYIGVTVIGDLSQRGTRCFDDPTGVASELRWG